MSTKLTITGGIGIALFAFAAVSGNTMAFGNSDAYPAIPISDNDEHTTPPIVIVYSNQYSIDLGGLERFHPFDIHKYKKIVRQLRNDGLLKAELLFAPQQITTAEILRVQSQAFLDSLKNKKNVVQYLEADALNLVPLGILESGVLKPLRYSAGGTVMAADLVIKNKSIAINIGGGYHHAKPDRGEGFCIYADIPIAIRKLQAEKKIKRALIIDVDAHQGNGTIKCLPHDNSTYCFSMHQGDIYPHPKEVGDLDISLKRGTGDEEFLKILEVSLPKITKLSKPDIIFVVGGCDPLSGDPLAGLEMTPAGIVKRDEMIVEFAVKKKIPIVYTLAGGYSKDAWKAQYQSVKNLLTKYGSKPKPTKPDEKTKRVSRF
jgi:histone deacetylase 11